MKAAAVMVGVLVAGLAANALAGSKVLGTMQRGSDNSAAFESLQSGKFKILSTNKLGANGLLLKMSIKGAVLGGVPANDPNTVLRFFLDANDLDGCQIYQSTAPVAVVDGKLSASVTGAQLCRVQPGPCVPVPEAALITPCGKVACLYNPFAPGDRACAGLVPGTDAD